MYPLNAAFRRGPILLLGVAFALGPAVILRGGAQIPKPRKPYPGVKELGRFSTRASITFHAISPDSKTLAYCTAEDDKPGELRRGQLILVDLATGKELRRRPTYGVSGGVFSPDGRQLAVVGWTGKRVGTIWDVGRWQPSMELTWPEAHIWGGPLAFSPEGKVLAGRAQLADDKRLWNNLILWDTTTGKARVLDPGGTTVMQSSSLGTLLRFTGPDGKDRTPRREPLVAGSPIAVSFLADGPPDRLIVEYAAGASLFTTVWDTRLGKPLRSDTYGRGWCLVYPGPSSEGGGSPPPGCTTEQYRLRTTPSGRILLLPRYRPPTLFAFHQKDGTIALVRRPLEFDFLPALVDRARTLPELVRLEEYKHTRSTGELTPDARRLVVMTSPPPRARGEERVSALQIWDVSGLQGDAAPKMKKLPPAERTRLWAVLFEDHPDPEVPNLLTFSPAQYTQAMQAMFSLVWHGDEAVAWLRTQMGRPFDLKNLPRLVADLDSPQFKRRQQAMRELERLGHLAQATLTQALAKRPPLETKKRIETLLGKLDGTAAAYELRQMRIIDVLEHINTPAARELLGMIAVGRYDPGFGDEARRALRRTRESRRN
jgi:hypothetical protein